MTTTKLEVELSDDGTITVRVTSGTLSIRLEMVDDEAEALAHQLHQIMALAERKAKWSNKSVGRV